MQRATPQLSETEMGFDFHNPVASVPRPLNTHADRAGVQSKANRRIALCRSVNEHKELGMAVYPHALCVVANII